MRPRSDWDDDRSMVDVNSSIEVHEPAGGLPNPIGFVHFAWQKPKPAKKRRNGTHKTDP